MNEQANERARKFKPGDELEVECSRAWCGATVLRVSAQSMMVRFVYGGTPLLGKVLLDRQPRKLFHRGVYYFAAATDIRVAGGAA